MRLAQLRLDLLFPWRGQERPSEGEADTTAAAAAESTASAHVHRPTKSHGHAHRHGQERDPLCAARAPGRSPSHATVRGGGGAAVWEGLWPQRSRSAHPLNPRAPSHLRFQAQSPVSPAIPSNGHQLPGQNVWSSRNKACGAYWFCLFACLFFNIYF